MTAACPLCGSPLADEAAAAELATPELDDQGIPFACSVQHGFGVPVVAPGSWEIRLDGARVSRGVVFDRRAGVIWKIAEGPNGKPILRDEGWYFEKREGTVTVQSIRWGEH